MKKSLLLSIAFFLSVSGVVFAIDPPIYFPARGVPSRVVAGDLNNDGHQDIAWITFDTDSLFTMLGNGNGGFGTRRGFAVPNTNLTSLALGDFNEDGNLDIVVVNSTFAGIGSVMIFYGNGNGTVSTPPQTLPGFNVGANDVAVADFNPSFFPFPSGTSHLDIAATINNANFNGVGVYFGNGNGTFSTIATQSTGGTGPAQSITAAFLPERFFSFVRRPANLIVSSPGSGNTGILISNGDGTFKPPVTVGTGLDNGVAWGDLNGDGILDIAAGRAGSNGVRVYLGTDSSGTAYGPPTDLTSSALHYNDVCRGDFNGDGLPDLAAVSDVTLPGAKGVITFFLNNGGGTFQSGTNDTTALPLSSCETADINRNGFPDLLVGALTSSGRDSVLVYNLRAPALNPNLFSLGNPLAGSAFALPLGTATDSSNVASIKFAYRQMGKIPFDTLNLTLGPGSKQRSFSGTLPVSAMTDRGLEYAVLSSDGFITERRPANGFARLRTTVNENAPATSDRLYQLVSFPFAAPQITANFSLTSPNEARLFWWDPILADTSQDTSSLRGYREFGSSGFPNFIPGRSMFLATNGVQTYRGAGLSTLPDTLGFTPEYSRLVIDSGWNMIATPYPYSVHFDSIDILLPDSTFHEVTDTVRANRIGTGGANLRERTATGYGAPSPPILKPWRGYFLKNNLNQQVVLLFPKQDDGFPSTAPPHPPAIAAGLDWKIDITAKSGDWLTPPTTLGASKGARREYDRLDWELPPPLAGDLRVSFPRGKDFGVPGDYLTDIRPPLAESETWDFAVQPGENRAIELNFEGLNEVPADYDLILTDVEGRSKQNLRIEPVYRFIASVERHFALAVMPKNPGGAAALMPTTYELYQNLPNPFNPQTLIKYDLPEAADVKLDVFNILGQKIATLVNTYQAAGPKSVVWDGTDAGGAKVASGVYFYKINAGSYSATKKMMFIK